MSHALLEVQRRSQVLTKKRRYSDQWQKDLEQDHGVVAVADQHGVSL